MHNSRNPPHFIPSISQGNGTAGANMVIRSYPQTQSEGKNTPQKMRGAGKEWMRAVPTFFFCLLLVCRWCGMGWIVALFFFYAREGKRTAVAWNKVR